MISNIKYQGSNGCIDAVVFDEPFDDYYNLLFTAATDKTNKLQDNYRQDIIKDPNTLFGYLIYSFEGNPALMYFVQREDFLPLNVARCFVKYYVCPDWQRTDARTTVQVWKEVYTKDEGQHNRELHLFKDYPNLLEDRGITTTFFTRNEGTRDRFLERIVKPAGFVKLPSVYMYRHVPQHLYVMGDPSFANNFEIK